jgi:hypothetical protein
MYVIDKELGQSVREGKRERESLLYSPQMGLAGSGD